MSSGFSFVCESFHSHLPRARWRNLVCVECLYMIKSMWLVFEATLSDECGI